MITNAVVNGSRLISVVRSFCLSWSDLDLQPGLQVKGGATRQSEDWIMASWAPDLFRDRKGFRISAGLDWIAVRSALSACFGNGE